MNFYFLEDNGHRSTVVSSMVHLVYGIKVSQSNHVYDDLLDEVGDAVAKTGVPGTFLVDVMPICDSSTFLFGSIS